MAVAVKALPFGLSLMPRRVRAVTILPGWGSSTVICFGLRPRASQPSSMAEPILPAPSKTRRPENLRSELLLANERFLGRVLGRFLGRLMATLYRQLRSYASPEVSNMAASSASRAPLPAQTTNWKEEK